MERLHSLFREGVLSHLEQLENLSNNLSAKQEQSRREEEALREKRETILQLKEERDELRAAIRQQAEEIKVLSVSDGEDRPPGPSSQETLQAMEGLRLEQLRGAMEGLWFSGISGKKMKHGICVCFSTAFEGHYLDSYYMEVTNLAQPSVAHHNIPPFIPLADIQEAHLPAGLNKFLSALSDHLNGFAGRKFQADQLQDDVGAYIPGSLQRSSLHTVISFSYNVNIKQRSVRIDAKLLYGVVTSVLPTEVLLTCLADAEGVQETTSAHSALFRSAPLHRVLNSLTA